VAHVIPFQGICSSCPVTMLQASDSPAQRSSTTSDSPPGPDREIKEEPQDEGNMEEENSSEENNKTEERHQPMVSSCYIMNRKVTTGLVMNKLPSHWYMLNHLG
jgi:hypothetical protein